MAYSVGLTNRARKELAEVPEPTRARVGDAIAELAEQPRPHGAVKLAGRGGELRIRVGNYRVVYRIDDAAAVVAITQIGHRREVYR